MGGGWRIRRSDAKLRVTCDFDEVSNIGAEEFLINYLSVQRPVIVKDALQSPGWQKLIPKWSRDSILKEMGDVEVSSGSIPYAHNFGLEVCCQPRTKGLMRHTLRGCLLLFCTWNQSLRPRPPKCRAT